MGYHSGAKPFDTFDTDVLCCKIMNRFEGKLMLNNFIEPFHNVYVYWNIMLYTINMELSLVN